MDGLPCLHAPVVRRPGAGRVLAVVGMRAEARLLPRGVEVVCAGGDPRRTAAALAARGPEGVRAVLSFGLAGGLDPALPAGALVSAGRLRCADGTVRPVDPDWSSRLAAVPGGRIGVLAGAAALVASPPAKRALRAFTGAVAVDLESDGAGAFAARHGLPFAVLRAVADDAGATLPHAAAVGLRPDGRPHLPRVLWALTRRPGELPDLIRAARASAAALEALAAAAARLGGDLGAG